ncbi:MAG TPA: hypothetical protein VGN20_05820 [Mucilaginibacter sp.]|jgi:hypothetical protein
METRYGAFLESYNKGNVYMDKIVQGFFDKISYDLNIIINGNDPLLTGKFSPIETIIKEPYRSSYDKMIAVVNVLDDVTISMTESEYKKNVMNIIYSLLDVAKTTEDSFLMDKALKIASQIPQILGS